MKKLVIYLIYKKVSDSITKSVFKIECSIFYYEIFSQNIEVRDKMRISVVGWIKTGDIERKKKLKKWKIILIHLLTFKPKLKTIMGNKNH